MLYIFSCKNSLRNQDFYMKSSNEKNLAQIFKKYFVFLGQQNYSITVATCHYKFV